MRTPKELYTTFKIMPSLQLHQLRVAAVAKLVCDSATKEVDTNEVLLECLFHDMGNIVKSDLRYFPDFVEPEGVEYWEKVKQEFFQKYGREQHEANAAIAREIGLPERVVDMMNNTGFSKIFPIVESDSFELKICQYADSRVGPRGILSLDGRLAEGRERYVAGRKGRQYYDTDEGFEKLSAAAHELERQLFADVSIKPEEITDASAAPVIEELWEYPVS